MNLMSELTILDENVTIKQPTARDYGRLYFRCINLRATHANEMNGLRWIDRVMGQRFDDEVNNRRKILNSLGSAEERLLKAFSSDFCHLDNQGGKITKSHIERYLHSHREHYVELVNQVLIWTPGRRIAEVGVAYGLTLLCLRDIYGYEVYAYELRENIPVYCKGLHRGGVPVHSWNLYDGNPPVAKGAFDMVICSEVVEHLYINLSAVLERIRPCLRIGGRLLLTTPNFYSAANVLRVIRGKNICQEHPSNPRYENGLVLDAREHIREYTFAEVRNAFTIPKWQLRKIYSFGIPSANNVKQNLLYSLSKWLLPYPVNNTLLAVSERRL